LEEADGLAVGLDEPRVDVFARESCAQLVVRERLVVPVPRHVGIRVPRNEQIDVRVGRPADGREGAANRQPTNSTLTGRS
jgi:hypothetical protein